MAGIGIAELTKIHTDLAYANTKVGQLVGPPEGLLGWFKFVKYNDGAANVRGIRGMLAEYAKPATSTNDVNSAAEPGFDTVTIDTSGASNLSAGILIGDSPQGLSGGGGVYANDQYGFIQLTGRPVVDLWMAAAAAPAIAIAQDELIIPHSTNDGIMNGVTIATSVTNLHQSIGYALADGELLLNDQSLVLFPSGLTGTARYSIDETVTLTGTGASGTAVVSEIFSSYSGATETQWGIRLTGTSMIIATSGNTTYTGGTSSGAEAVALAEIAERIKAVNVRLTLPLS